MYEEVRNITRHKKVMDDIHRILALTHRHHLAQSAWGIYLAITVRIIDGYELKEAIQEGIKEALAWYECHDRFTNYVVYWGYISNTECFQYINEESIYSGGYVVETMETVLWCLLNTQNYKECVLRCVNLGYDADTTAAVAGGLAGMYYGYNSTPKEWIEQLTAKEIIDESILAIEKYCQEL